MNESGFAVSYDMDRSLGQGPSPDYYYDWPVVFCARQGVVIVFVLF